MFVENLRNCISCVFLFLTFSETDIYICGRIIQLIVITLFFILELDAVVIHLFASNELLLMTGRDSAECIISHRTVY